MCSKKKKKKEKKKKTNEKEKKKKNYFNKNICTECTTPLILSKKFLKFLSPF